MQTYVSILLTELSHLLFLPQITLISQIWLRMRIVDSTDFMKIAQILAEHIMGGSICEISNISREAAVISC